MPTSTARLRQEIPPTAGLPLHFGDLLPPTGSDLPQEMARFLGVPQAGIECSGTACLVIILHTLHRLSGRRTVIVPAYTCPLVAFAVAHCGLTLKICDVRPGSFELDLQALTACCDADTLAILPTHLGGRVADVALIADFARPRGIYVVEDAAQALGAHSEQQTVGLKGDAAFFSLAAGKGLSLFEGGVWISRDPALAEELSRTSANLIPRRPLFETLRCLQLIGYTALYRPAPLRYVYGTPLRDALRRNDTVEAAGDVFDPDIPLHRVSRWRQSVGCRGLARLRPFQVALKVQALARLPHLAALPGVTLCTDRAGDEGVWPFFFMLMPDASVRDAILAELWGSGLGLARLFAHALPDYAYLRPWIAPQECPNARDFAARSLTLTNSLWLDDARFGEVLGVLERYLR